jgi:hypothetical protein
MAETTRPTARESLKQLSDGEVTNADVLADFRTRDWPPEPPIDANETYGEWYERVQDPPTDDTDAEFWIWSASMLDGPLTYDQYSELRAARARARGKLPAPPVCKRPTIRRPR